MQKTLFAALTGLIILSAAFFVAPSSSASGPSKSKAAGALDKSDQPIAWTPELSMKVKAVGGVRVSPDGKRVLYTVNEPLMTAEKSEYLTQIWMTNADGGDAYQLTFGEKSSTNPDWSPDGNLKEVQSAAEAFIKAFNNLDWEQFRNCFADDATVFFPSATMAAARANGRTEIEAIFKTLFDAARKRKDSPPYLSIEPKDMRIRMSGNAAVVTFHLGGKESLGRRTVIFEKQKGRWLIIHLHASTMAI